MKKDFKNSFTIKAKVWLYPGMAGWHFVSLPKTKSEEVKENFGKKAKGWGSLPVVASLGKTSWESSIFPDKHSGTYLFPLKASVRKKEGVYEGDNIRISFKIK
jgi:hypothetical protein